MDIIQILLCDPDDNGYPAARWARENCPGFVRWDCVDVTDVSYEHDYVAEYIFNNKEDSVFFQMRWR
jgi:hypothetical protein